MRTIETVGDLRKLLEGVSDATRLAVAPVPARSGWINAILNLKGSSDDAKDVLILGLEEEVYGDDGEELGKIVFRDADGLERRPV